MTTADYLNDLVKQRNRLAGLLARCTDATAAEKFNDLIDRLEQLIPQKGFIATKYDANGCPTEGVVYGMTSLSDYFLAYRTKLQKIKLSGELSSIGSSAFRQCEGLKSVVIPDTVKFIGTSAFINCKSLENVTFSNQLATIAVRAFDGCVALENIIFPGSVNKIDEYSFNGCKKLAAVTFNGTPVSIHANAFASCTNTTTINVPWAEGAVANAPWGAVNATINYNYAEEASE